MRDSNPADDLASFRRFVGGAFPLSKRAQPDGFVPSFPAPAPPSSDPPDWLPFTTPIPFPLKRLQTQMGSFGQFADPAPPARPNGFVRALAPSHPRLSRFFQTTLIPVSDTELLKSAAALTTKRAPSPGRVTGWNQGSAIQRPGMGRYTADLLPLLLLAFLAPVSPSHRALWVWDPHAGTEVVAFAHGRGITDLFLQWAPSADASGLREFLRAATGAGIAVHALDGWPEAALPENHAEVLKIVDAVLRFNREAPPGERFAGVHFDIEPYLLMGFDGPLRGEILGGFVELQKKIAARLAGSGVAYGADLPFWFDEGTIGQVLGSAQNVGIMDYRNQARGEDGIVAHARPWIAAGDRLRRAVWIAVETAPAPASETRYVASFAEEAWAKLDAAGLPVLRQSRFAGFGLRTASRDGRRFLGLAAPAEGGSARDFAAAQSALREIALKAGGRREQWDAAAAALPKTTFDGKPLQELERQLDIVAEELRGAPSFYGIAIHHYGSYRKMQ